MSEEELKESIRVRIALGEPIENIKLDLKDQDINILALFDEELKGRQKIVEQYEELKTQGLSEEAIETKLQAEYAVDSTGMERLKSDVNKKGRGTLLIGFGILLLGVLFVCGDRRTWKGITLIVSGSILIWKGYSQQKE